MAWRKRRVDEAIWMFWASAFRDDPRLFGRTEPVVFLVEWERDRPKLMLTDLKASWTVSPLCRGWEKRVELEPLPWRNGGTRWWFRCGKCVRRCCHLYAAHLEGAVWCRECMYLTYQSAQQWDNLKRTGRIPGLFGRCFEAAVRSGDADAVLRKIARRRC